MSSEKKIKNQTKTKTKSKKDESRKKLFFCLKLACVGVFVGLQAVLESKRLQADVALELLDVVVLNLNGNR